MFDQTCSWLENKNHVFTLIDVKLKMKELAGGEPLYEVQRIKQKLEKKFKSNVLIGKILGQKTVICFKNMANCIVSNKWYEKRKANVEDETNWIIETAAEIIGSNIKQFLLSKFDLPAYPSLEKLIKLIEFLITCYSFYIFSLFPKERLKASNTAL